MSKSKKIEGAGEIARITSDFLRLSAWDWSLWVLAALFFLCAFVFSFFRDLSLLHRAQHPLSLGFLCLAALAPAAAAGLFQQFLVSRSVRSSLLRSFACLSSFFCFLVFSGLLFWLSGIEKRERKEELVYHCITRPDANNCRSIAKRNSDLSLPPEAKKLLEEVPLQPGYRRFSDLIPKNQLFVKDQYAALLIDHEKKNFVQMLEHTRNILAYVDEFNDTRSYESIAKRGLDQVEEERKRKELEERLRVQRIFVAEQESLAQKAFEGAKQDKAARMAFENALMAILERDPNNRVAADLKSKMQALDKEASLGVVRRELATLEIKGQKLLKRGRKNAAARAELYKLMDEVYLRDPESKLPEEWKRMLKK